MQVLKGMKIQTLYNSNFDLSTNLNNRSSQYALQALSSEFTNRNDAQALLHRLRLGVLEVSCRKSGRGTVV